MQEPKFRTCPKCKAETEVDAEECPKCEFPLKRFDQETDYRMLVDEEIERRKKEGKKTKKGPYGLF